ncbi:putative TetR family transcriptional regulator [Oscillibacter valericigenes Sjm18-20]|nr:putative TetR family transcriptional regulator [Oscillibacter valericigenes Sjm18-20]
MSKISDQRRADILQAALTEFGFRGVDGASMSEIAARAGIGKSTIYEYFPSKTKLFIASCRAKIQKMEEQLRLIFTQETSFSRQMELYVEMMLELARGVDFNEILQMFSNDSLKELELVMAEFSNNISAMVEQAIRRAQATGELIPDLEVDIAAAYMLSLPNPHLIFRLQMLGKKKPVKAVVKLALQGIQAKEHQENT